MYTTKQEIFDAVWKGLESQNWEPSVDIEGQCMYRGPNGLKCAIGCLIPDEKYQDWFEMELSHLVCQEGIGISDRDLVAFLQELQMAHDDAAEYPDVHEVGNMSANVERVGLEHGLIVPGS